MDRCLGLALAILIAQPFAAMGEPSSSTQDVHEKVSELARQLDVKAALLPAVESMFPPGVSRELASLLFGSDTSLWAAVENDYETALAATFDEEQLDSLLEMFSSPEGQLWLESVPALQNGLRSSMEKNHTAVMRLTSAGCVVGMLSPNIQAAKEQAGLSGEGIPEELLASSKPILDAASRTCDCVMKQAADRWGIEQLTYIQTTPGFQTLVQELFESGKCPLPSPDAAAAE